MENENRVRLLRLIQARPGLGVRDAGRRAGIAMGATAYHVEYLEREGKISTTRYQGRRLLWPYPKAPSGTELAKRVLLEDAGLYAVYMVVRGLGPIAQGGVLASLEGPRTTIQHRLDRLVRGGLLRVQWVGRSRVYEVIA